MTRFKTALLAASLLSGAAAAQAQPAGTYRALGTEPFWSVTLAGGNMTYDDAEGRRISVAAPRGISTVDGRVYRSRRLVLRISEGRPCSDGMSDRTYADTVRVTVDGRELDGCGGAFTEPSRLANTHWRITAINGRRLPVSGPYELNFEEQRLSGRAGCNRLGGSYRLEGNRLTPGRIVATRMACPGPAMRHEQAALRVLSGPLRVSEPSATTMVLSGRGGSLRLVLVPGARPRR